MTAKLYEFQGDTYRPCRKHGDDDVTTLADARMLKEIEIFASHARQATEHDFKPLDREVRQQVLEMWAILKKQPLQL